MKTLPLYIQEFLKERSAVQFSSLEVAKLIVEMGEDTTWALLKASSSQIMYKAFGTSHPSAAYYFEWRRKRMRRKQ